MKNFFSKALYYLKYTALAFFLLSLFSVILFKYVNPPLTPLMVIRYFEYDNKNDDKKFEKDWVSFENISPNIVLATVAAEDNNFPTHFGVDWEAIEKAHQLNKYNQNKHGGSTITQQTAKNLFLTPSRTIIRKGFELYFTFLIETFWSKKRILEVYLNIIELGNGVYGVEAASQRYFHKPASKLTRNEAALITSVLPSPRKRNLARPNGYMYYYQGRVLKLMDQIEKVNL